MGDNNVSEASSINYLRPKDELQFIDEIGPDKQPSRKESLSIQENEEPVTAAVGLVVSSARHGVVSLCASVAHILREKKKLQQRVADLEKQMIALENNSSGTVSINGSCSVHCQATDLHSFQESPVSQRCGSAPAGFIANGLKFLRTDYPNNVECTQDGGSRHGNLSDNKCDGIHEPGTVECRTSSISMPETHSNLVPKIVDKNDRKNSFIRGPTQTSTRSLNINRSLPASSFIRRKYSTISLRRVRRSSASRQKASSTCSTSSINSSISNTNNEDQKCGSSSCIITVAEVHTPPGQQIPVENTEGEAIKLLARTLTSVLQGDGTHQGNCSNESSDVSVEVNDPQALNPHTHQELCLPHPLAGCECVICLRLAADPSCHLYALTTEGGSLLPCGSRVLVEGERVGTVIYLGHEKYCTKYQSTIYPGSTETSLAQEGYLRPVGVTVKLWAPDQSEIFVPLNAVICQLDDDLDIHRKGSLSNFEYEYLDEDSDEECVFSNSNGSLEHPQVIGDVSDVQKHTPEISTKPIDHKEIQETRRLDIKEWKPTSEDYFIRSPSVSSYNSNITHSLGDLSIYGLDCVDDDHEFSTQVNFSGNLQEPCSSYRGSFTLNRGSQSFSSNPGSETQEVLGCGDSTLNTTFICKAVDEDTLPEREICQENDVSLYDTCDSAISLAFTRRLQHSEDNSEPSSLTDTGRESPHFGDTWDSGCSVGRGRCKSDSSGHFSDVELENSRLKNTFTKSLSDALNSVLQSHKINSNYALEKHKIKSERNIHGDRTPVDTEFFKRLSRKDTFHCYEIPMKNTEHISSYKCKLNENISGQSEV